MGGYAESTADREPTALDNLDTELGRMEVLIDQLRMRLGPVLDDRAEKMGQTPVAAPRSGLAGRAMRLDDLSNRLVVLMSELDI